MEGTRRRSRARGRRRGGAAQRGLRGAGHRRDRATQGDMPIVPEPYAPAAQRLGMPSMRCSTTCGHARAGLLRRVPRSFPPSRGLLRERMGVWKVPRSGSRDRAADGSFRGFPCYQRPTYEDWPTPCSRWRTVARRRSATRSSTRSRRTRGSATRATLTPRPSSRRSAALLTMIPRLGGQARLKRARPGSGLTSTNVERLRRRPHAQDLPRSAPDRGGYRPRRERWGIQRALRARPRRPPRRRQLARTRDARDRPRPNLHRPCLRRADHRRRRQRLHRLRLLLGSADRRHAHPQVLEAIAAAAAKGTSFGARPKRRSHSPRRSPAASGAQMLRMTSSGTEAAMTAIRLARAHTGREKIIQVRRSLHGHSDALLAEAGSGLLTQGSRQARRARRSRATLWSCRGTTRPRSRRRSPATRSRHHRRAIAATWASSAGPRFLELLGERATATGALLSPTR